MIDRDGYFNRDRDRAGIGIILTGTGVGRDGILTGTGAGPGMRFSFLSGHCMGAIYSVNRLPFVSCNI